MQRTLRGKGCLTGRPPFGYMVVPSPKHPDHKTLAPTEEGRKYVPEIFSRAIAGEVSDLSRAG